MSKDNNGIFWLKKIPKSFHGCNWLCEWELFIEFQGMQWKFCTIIQFVKGEYCLPQSLFPRDSFYSAQKTKTLQSAKHKCEQALQRFAELAAPVIKYKK